VQPSDLCMSFLVLMLEHLRILQEHNPEPKLGTPDSTSDALGSS